MNILIPLTLLFVVVASQENTPTPSESTKKPFGVFGYLPEYRYNGFNFEAAFETGVTHLIFFSLEIDDRGMPSALDRLPSKEQAKQAREAADKYGGKLLLSFGGNSRSENYGHMATNIGRRKRFLNNVNKLLIEYKLDGVDYNWEYPASREEWSAWRHLLMDSKRIFLGGKNIVTFTIYVDPKHYSLLHEYYILDEADYVLVMAYDQHGEHSTFHLFEEAIMLAERSELDLSKVCVGVPFYARHVSSGVPKMFNELVDQQAHPNSNYVGPYYFNSAPLLEKKTRYAIEKKCGGIMIWELGQDVQPLNKPNSLMKGIQKALKAEKNEL
eukprot:PhF_6_TR9440/c0_g1_i1/m.14751/K01183/E3.2.1.14; chitinase